MRRPMVLFVAFALAAAGCGGGGSGGGSGVSGEVAIDGSSTVFPISEALAEEFMLVNSGVQVRVGQSGTGGGFEKFCNGETDISNASRPINDEEAQNCEANGIEPIEMQVAIDGLTVAVNPGNDFVECLTTDELAEMWKPGSTIERWSDVRSEWPDEPIKFYSPGADSGTFDYFTEEIVGEGGAMRTGPEVQTSEDDNILVQGVQGDLYSVGYFGFAYYAENREAIKAVAVDAGEGCVQPTEDTVESGEYTPLSRPLFIYPASSALQRPAVVAFVEFYIESVNDLVGDVGYVPVPEAELEEARTKLEDATT